MTTIPVEVVVVCRVTAAAGPLVLADACRRAGARVRILRPAELLGEARDPAARRVLVMRLPSGTPSDDLLALQGFEDQGAAIVNRPSRLLRVQDKAASLTALAAADLPVVETLVVRRDGPEPDLARLPGERFVVKPIHGASGRGVTVGLSASQALKRARAFADLSGPALVQPFLGGGIDRRAFVIEGEVVASMQRTPHASGGRGNAFQGARVEAWHPDDEERQRAVTAARVLGLDVAGVDLLADGRILEVNGCPGLDAIAQASGRDVAADLADFALRRAALR